MLKAVVILVCACSRTAMLYPRRKQVQYEFAGGLVLLGDICNYHPELTPERVEWKSSATNISQLLGSTPTARAIEFLTRDSKLLDTNHYASACDLEIHMHLKSKVIKKAIAKIKAGMIVCIHGGISAPSEWFTSGHPLVHVPYFLLTFDAQGMMFPGRPVVCPYPFCYEKQAFASVDLAVLESPMLLQWFALGGVAARHPKLTPIILGHDDSTPPVDFLLLRAAPKTRLLHSKFCISPDRSPDRRIALDRTWDIGFELTEHLEISEIYAAKANQPEVPVEDEVQEGDVRFLQEISQSMFVLSPPGGGWDTYRTWQALMVGSIPIVLENEYLPGLQELWEDLPILRVSNYTDLTLDFLRTSFSALMPKFDTYAWNRATPEYFVRRIRGAKLAYLKESQKNATRARVEI